MSDQTPGPAYRIETERLVIRCWNPVDAPLLKAAIDGSLDYLRPWMSWAHDEPQPLDQKIALLRRQRGLFDRDEDFVYGIFDGDETEVWGGTGLHTRRGAGVREIGYWVHVDHVNKGVATETVSALTKVAFEIDGVHRVEIHCDPRNRASAAIPRKLGYVHEVTRRRLIRGPDGDLRDTMIWTLLRDEYPESPAEEARIAAFDAAGRRLITSSPE